MGQDHRGDNEMKIHFSAGRQFKSISIIPGIDIIWYYKSIIIAVLFLFWSFSVTFAKGEIK